MKKGWILGLLFAFSSTAISQKAERKTSALINYIDRLEIYSDHNQAIHSLLKHGADINAKNSKGETLLLKAAAVKNIGTVKMLLESGADVNLGTEDGDFTPLHIACLQEENSEIVELFLDSNADINSKTSDGSTPLHLALQNKNFEYVKLLLAADADVNVKRDDGSTTLHDASWSGNLESIRLLITANADVNAKMIDGKTPLFIASSRGDLEIVKLLISSGADINTRVKISESGIPKEYTPLGAAIKNQDASSKTKAKDYSEIIKLMMNLNAEGAIFSQQDSILKIYARFGLETNGGNLVMKNGQWVPEEGTTVSGEITLGVKLDGLLRLFPSKITGTKMIKNQLVFLCENGESFFVVGQTPHPYNSAPLNESISLAQLTKDYRKNKSESLAWQLWKLKSANKE